MVKFPSTGEALMAVWLVRAGRRGEEEPAALGHNLVTIAWNELPDLSNIQDREARADLWQVHTDIFPRKLANEVGQVWAFRSRINEGDLAVLPLNTQSVIAIGKPLPP